MFQLKLGFWKVLTWSFAHHQRWSWIASKLRCKLSRKSTYSNQGRQIQFDLFKVILQTQGHYVQGHLSRSEYLRSDFKFLIKLKINAFQVIIVKITIIKSCKYTYYVRSRNHHDECHLFDEAWSIFAVITFKSWNLNPDLVCSQLSRVYLSSSASSIRSALMSGSRSTCLAQMECRWEEGRHS